MRGSPSQARCLHNVPGQSQAAEDLPADRQVPVAEGRPDRGAADRPGAARGAPGSHRRRTARCSRRTASARSPATARSARTSTPTRRRSSAPRRTPRRPPGRPRQEPVAAPAAEVGQLRRPVRVAPGPASPPPERGIPGAGLLPLLLGRESGAGPGGVRLCLEVADVLDGLVARDLLDEAEPAARPVGGPEQRPLQTGRDAVLPAARRPPARLVVASGLDERLPLGVGHRHPGDPEGGQVDRMGRPFVVERPRFDAPASTPRVNGPAGTSTSRPGRSARAATRVPTPSRGAPSRSWWVASIVSTCCCSCCSTIA